MQQIGTSVINEIFALHFPYVMIVEGEYFVKQVASDDEK